MRTVFLTVLLAAGLMVAGPKVDGLEVDAARADVAGGWQAYLKSGATIALAELEPAAEAGCRQTSASPEISARSSRSR